jgi:hypothetical protein
MRTISINQISFPDFEFFLGKARKFIWIIFAAQSWALWRIRNKFSIEGEFPNQPTDCVFKTVLLQEWRPITRSKDLELMDRVIGMMKQLFNMTYSPATRAANS